MAKPVKLPDVGEGITEGQLVKWLVKKGDTIKADQPIAEIETDKALVEIPAPEGGVILELFGKEGDTVKVGSILATVGAPGEAAPPLAVGVPKVPKAEAVPKAEVPPGAAAVPEAAPKVEAPKVEAEAAPVIQKQVLATPATRKLARELGIDINKVKGTGPGGRIIDEDVKKFAEMEKAPKIEKIPEKEVPIKEVPVKEVPVKEVPVKEVPVKEVPEKEIPPAAVVKPPVPAEEERVPLRGVRKVIADNMAKSAFTMPQVTAMDEVDVTDLVALREKYKKFAEEQGVKLTYMPFIIKATIVALKEFPYFNASLDEKTNEIVLKKYYNIGIATDTPEGLMAPVIKNADKKSIMELAKEVARLAEEARTRKIQISDLKNNTFTITNPGSIRGMFSTPIINPPDIAILGVHAIKDRPVVRDGEIKIRKMLYLALTFDHRIVDGAQAARFMNTIIRHLENPDLLLIDMG